MTEKNNFTLFFEGIFSKNPIFFLILGMCPTLAVTTSIDNALGMAVATLFVLVFSCILISGIRKLIPENIRIPAFIVIIAGFVTVANLFMEALAPALYERLGVYVLLIVVNCIVLGRSLAFAYKNPIIPSFFDSFGMGIGFSVALIIISAIRELIGTSKIALFGNTLISLPVGSVSMMVLPPGALLTMGLLLALINYARK